MIDILKSDLSNEYINFWYNIGVELQKRIKGIIQILYDITSGQIIVKVFIEKFNFGIYFSFPYRLTDEVVLQHILNGIELKVYEEVFKNERGEK
jgi:hypothetical protein